jgi:hypothetical protein
MLPKSRTEDTQGSQQITCDIRYSLFLGGFRTSCIGFRSIEYERVSLWLEPSHLLTMIGIMCVYIT